MDIIRPSTLLHKHIGGADIAINILSVNILRTSLPGNIFVSLAIFMYIIGFSIPHSGNECCQYPCGAVMIFHIWKRRLLQ